MQDLQNPQAFDHSSDPAFLDYYTAQSASAATLDRFSRIRDKALKLLVQHGSADASLQVLDIACGAGTQTRLWAELGHQLHGLDVNEPLINVARARAHQQGLSIEFRVGSATELPYADGSMDVCLMPELLEHVQDWESCLREAVRVLRPGGLLFLSTSNALCPKQHEFNLPIYSWYPAALKRHFERLAITTRPDLANHARYPAVHWFTIYGLSQYLGRLGVQCMDRFDVMDTQGWPAIHRWLVASIRQVALLRFFGHVLTPGTSIFGFKRA